MKNPPFILDKQRTKIFFMSHVKETPIISYLCVLNVLLPYIFNEQNRPEFICWNQRESL
jgi:hypothetical protein